MMRTTSGGGIEMVTRFTRGCLVSTGVALAGLFAPAVSGAATGTIPGDPLAITADGVAHLQVKAFGASGPKSGAFAPSDQTVAAAPGFCLLLNSGSFPLPACADPTPITPPPATPTGTGSSGDPYTLTTTYAYGDLDVTQTLTYVNGDSFFTASYAITNTGSSPATFRALVQGHLEHAGTTTGQGFIVPGNPVVEVGAFNDTQGTLGTLNAVTGTPWSHYEEASAASFPVDASSAGGLTDSIQPLPADNWVGADFDQYISTGLGVGQSTPVPFAVKWAFGRFAGLVVSPDAATVPTGQTATLTASSLEQGVPVAGKPVRYTVTGANSGSGSAITGADGSATIKLSGVNAGADTVTTYIDANDNGVYDSQTETQCVVQVIWTGGPATQPAPGPGQTGTTPSAPTPPAAPTSAQFSASLLKALTATGTAAKLGPLLKRHNYRFTYHALGAGRLTVSWYHVPKGGHLAKRTRPAPLLVATTTTTFTKAGNAKVTIKLTAAGAKFLRRLQHVKLTGRAVFTPTGKPPVTVIKSFTLTR